MIPMTLNAPGVPLRIVSALALAAALSACASFDHSPVAAPAIDVAALGAKPAAIEWPREDWWRRYGDAQLDALVAEGLADSPTLAAAKARVVKAQANAGVARSALFPQINGTADITYQRYSENYIFPP